MPYTKTDWKDRVVEKPLTYNLITNADGTTTLDPEEGAIVETGTPINAVIMNNLETQYDKAVADSLPRAGGALTGPLTSNSDITTTGNVEANNGTFSGNVTANTLNVTGEVVAEIISLKTTNGNQRLLVNTKPEINTAGNSGFGIAIGAGGTTIIGGGESAQAILANASYVPDGGTERLLLTSDNNVEILTGMQNVGTDATVGKRFVFAQNGDLNVGGSNVDGAIGVIRYNTATKTFTLGHWTGSVSTYNDVVLEIGDVDFNKTWIDMALTGGALEYSTNTQCRYKKMGGVVYIKGAIKNITAIGVTIFTLPVGYRPDIAMSFGLPTSGKNFARWTIGSDGRIVLENVSQTGNPTATDWFPITMSFAL